MKNKKVKIKEVSLTVGIKTFPWEADKAVHYIENAMGVPVKYIGGIDPYDDSAKVQIHKRQKK